MMKNALLLVSIFSGTMACQTTGAITGVVVDELNNPVASAEVHIADRKPFFGHRLVEYHETDSDGSFNIQNVPFGTYDVLAGKEEVGYPDPKFSFYSNDEVPTVSLASSYPSVKVIVKIGPKGGILNKILVLDAISKKNVESAVITLSRVSNPKFSITTSSTVAKLLVPSDTKIRLVVTAPGYKPWSNDQIGSNSLILHPGQSTDLTVLLTPEQNGPERQKP